MIENIDAIIKIMMIKYPYPINIGNNDEISIAHMTSPKGWEEAGQTPEFHEYTLVLEGELTVRTSEETFCVKSGQSIITYPGEWVKYETKREGANYIAICLPAFSQENVNRDD